MRPDSSPSSIGLWLSWQELSGRKLVFAINVVIVALLVALPVTLDLLGKARKISVDTMVDYTGPSMSLVPKGILSADLVTARLKDRTFPERVLHRLKREGRAHLRAAEPRLITRLTVAAKEVPVVGVDFKGAYSYPFSMYSPGDGEVLAGELAAKKLGLSIGGTVTVGARTFTVSGVIPTTGGIEDVSLFMPLDALQGLTGKEGRINEIRIFPASSESLEKLRTMLGSFSTETSIVDSFRGDVVEKDIDSTLRKYQRGMYLVAFTLIALCIVISTYINVDGRRAEISAVYTLGATEGFVFRVLTLRAAWIALLGSAAGQMAALIVTMAESTGAGMQDLWSWSGFFLILLATVALGLLVTAPFTLYTVYRKDLISHL